MFFKKCLIGILILYSVSAKSQTFLNLDSVTIKHKLALQGGTQILNKINGDLEDLPPHYVIVFKFKFPTFQDNGINMMVFYVSRDNRCFEYMVSYINDDKYIEKIKKELNKSNSDVKQVKDSLTWINPKKKYVIKFLHSLRVNGQTPPTVLLDVKKQ